MKKSLVIFIGLLTLAAFTGSVMAQGQTKPAAPAATEKQAVPAPDKSKATEPKSEKKEATQDMKASGTVSAYEAGKLIRVKEKDKEMVFDLTGQTAVKGEVKDGAQVTVMYKKDGNKMVATDITVTTQKKAEEKKPAPAEKKS
jgi:hypothetical protein